MDVSALNISILQIGSIMTTSLLSAYSLILKIMEAGYNRMQPASTLNSIFITGSE